MSLVLNNQAQLNKFAVYFSVKRNGKIANQRTKLNMKLGLNVLNIMMNCHRNVLM